MPAPSAPPRRRVALVGPSRPIDPATAAVRPDIADVRLADRVFAPHYAEPVARVLSRDAVLRLDRAPTAATVARLAAGDAFELLDVTGGDAWGIAVATGRVGYLPADALA